MTTLTLATLAIASGVLCWALGRAMRQPMQLHPAPTVIGTLESRASSDLHHAVASVLADAGHRPQMWRGCHVLRTGEAVYIDGYRCVSLRSARLQLIDLAEGRGRAVA